MATDVFDVRIQGKRDTSANFTAADPVLLPGEIITVVTASGEVRHKTGDGKKKYTQLPFDDEAVRNLVNSKIVYSATQPSGQKAGDHWCKIITREVM